MANKKKDKEGVSPVIATVLLIVIVLVIVAILAFLLMPTFREKLKERAECVELVNALNFYQSSYLCYYDDSNNEKDRTSMPIQITSTGIGGFRLALFTDGDSDTIDITNGYRNGILMMLGGEFGEELEVLNDGSVRTYVAKGVFKRVGLSAILADGYKCTSTQKSVELQACKDRSSIQVITEPPGGGCTNPSPCSQGQTQTCITSQGTGTQPCINSCNWGPCIVNPQGPVCGNNVREGNEECDDEFYNMNDDTYFNINSNDDDGICVIDGERASASCKNSVCGDGYKNIATEQCDDGNTQNGDGCSSLCVNEIPQQECELTNARWSAASRYEGESVNLIVEGINCDGKILSIDIKEYDIPPRSDDLIANDLDVEFDGESAILPWNSLWVDDSPGLLETNPPEYYFVAEMVEGTTEITISSPYGLSGFPPAYHPEMLRVYACGDKIRTNPPEECDGNKLGEQSCTSLGFVGGSLSCYPRGNANQCRFNTELCTGQGPACTTNPQCTPGQTQQCTTGTGELTCNLNCQWQGQCTPNPGEVCGNGICLSSEVGQCCIDCPNSGGSCGPVSQTGCGNAILEPPEECDDGNRNNNDGCSSICKIEEQWTCWNSPGSLSLCCPHPNSGLPVPSQCPSGSGINQIPGTIGDPGTWNYWTGNGQNTCSSSGPFSCSAVFGSQGFGWSSIQNPQLSCGEGVCSSYEECGDPPSFLCPSLVPVTWQGFHVCCMENGIIDVRLINCEGMCAID